MGKNLSFSDFNKKNSLPYLKCVLRLSCVVHGPIYGFLCKLKLSCVPRRNLKAIGAVGPNFRPFSFGGSVAAASLECLTLVNLYIERKPFA